MDPAAELAAAKERLARLTRAEAQGVVFRAKESVAAKKRELESLKAALASKQEESKQFSKALDTAKDSATKTKLKADLKTSAMVIKETEAAIKKCSVELSAEQARAAQTAEKVASRQ